MYRIPCILCASHRPGIAQTSHLHRAGWDKKTKPPCPCLGLIVPAPLSHPPCLNSPVQTTRPSLPAQFYDAARTHKLKGPPCPSLCVLASFSQPASFPQTNPLAQPASLSQPASCSSFLAPASLFVSASRFQPLFPSLSVPAYLSQSIRASHSHSALPRLSRPPCSSPSTPAFLCPPRNSFSRTN